MIYGILHQKCSVMLRMHQIHLSPGLCPDPTGGAHNASLDLLVGWGGKYPLYIPHPLDTYSASFTASAAPHLELGGLASMP